MTLLFKTRFEIELNQFIEQKAKYAKTERCAREVPLDRDPRRIDFGSPIRFDSHGGRIGVEFERALSR